MLDPPSRLIALRNSLNIRLGSGIDELESVYLPKVFGSSVSMTLQCIIIGSRHLLIEVLKCGLQALVAMRLNIEISIRHCVSYMA